MTKYLAAAIQMNSGPDKPANLQLATQLIRESVGRGARFVALPELFNCLGLPEQILAEAEPIPGPTSETLCRLAAQQDVTILAGSIAERDSESQQVYNTSLLISGDGKILARYRKIHLFGINLPGRVTFQESKFFAAGDRLSVASTHLGRIGQAICYDLRFPELFRRLATAGADLLCVPSAFTQETGCDHWELLLRARAIENQLYVVAPNQHGRHTPAISTYGRSMIVDPWGIPLSIATDGISIAMAEIDPARTRDVRERLPAMQNRRPIEQFDLDQTGSVRLT
jgi:predicted amidohydrolase